MNGQNREDFPQKVIDTIAKRAGYMCSWPKCGKRTVGPGDSQSQIVNIGVAAHINAAAPGGPRYDPQQTSEQRAAAENAIWLCQDHGKMADADTTKYPDHLLRNWKKVHEEHIRQTVGKQEAPALTVVSGEHIARGRGNVTGLDIQGPAIIKPGTRSLAEGEGNITGTRIGGPKSDHGN